MPGAELTGGEVGEVANLRRDLLTVHAMCHLPVEGRAVQYSNRVAYKRRSSKRCPRPPEGPEDARTALSRCFEEPRWSR